MPNLAVDVTQHSSRSVEHVAPLHHEVSLLLERITGVALACPVDTVILVDALAALGHVPLPRTFILGLLPTDKLIRQKSVTQLVLRAKNLLLLNKEAAIGRLIGTAFSRVLEGRLVRRPVEALAVARCKALSVGVDTEVVNSVGILEELLVGRVLLDVTPSATLPAAGHKVQILVHLHLVFTHIHGLHGGGRTTPNNVATVGGEALQTARVRLGLHHHLRLQI